MRKILPIAAAVVCGLFALVDFFVPDPSIDAIGAILAEGVTILAAFALLLGVLNLLGVHLRRVGSNEPGRVLSLILVLSLLLTLGIGIIPTTSTALDWTFDYIYYPIQATLAALLAFFAVSAAYRAFKLRGIGPLVFLLVGLFVLATQLPLSAYLSPYLPAIRDWILAVPVTAGVRGIILGVALGTIGSSLRILLAVDHPYAPE